MPLSEARKRANKKWNDANTKLFSCRLRNYDFDEIEKHRDMLGLNRTQYLLYLFNKVTKGEEDK